MSTLTATVNSKQKFEVIPSDKSKGVINGDEVELDIQEKEGSYHILLENKSYSVDVVELDRENKKARLLVNGNPYVVEVKDQYDALLEKMGMGNLGKQMMKELKAPMPGLVISVLVAAGDSVKKDEPLIILEAMKMENVLKATADGVVKSVEAETSNSVEKNQVLINFE